MKQAVLQSRHCFGRLRMAKVPEPTPAPTYSGRLRLQAKKGDSRRLRLHTLKIFFLSFKKLIVNQCCGAGAGGAEITWDLEPEPKFNIY